MSHTDMLRDGSLVVKKNLVEAATLIRNQRVVAFVLGFVAAQIQRTSPRLKAKMAGGFYALAVVSAVLIEAYVHGKMLLAAGLIPVFSFAVVTVLLYLLLRPVSGALASLAAVFNFISLALEASEIHLRGANIALFFHGLYCLVISLLVFRSGFLPRVLGILMAAAGFAWLTDLSIPFTNHLAPYNVIVGFIGEGVLMLWLLLRGIDRAYIS